MLEKEPIVSKDDQFLNSSHDETQGVVGVPSTQKKLEKAKDEELAEFERLEAEILMTENKPKDTKNSERTTPVDAKGGPRATSNVKLHQAIEETKQFQNLGPPHELNFELDSESGKMRNFDDYVRASLNVTEVQDDEVNSQKQDEDRSFCRYQVPDRITPLEYVEEDHK